MAESIFRHKVQAAGLSDQFEIDSAGTGNWHVGENPDPRTIRVLAENGIHVYSRARQVHPKDFQRFDYVIAMDEANYNDLVRLAGGNQERISKMMQWELNPLSNVVPDPYYGEIEDFRRVYDLLDGATDSLLDNLREKLDLTRTR